MEHHLGQLTDLQDKFDCPVVCAGDIFDKWNSPPELINFALKYLPFMYAVYGQHDLPFHNPKLLKRSAFWTLVTAGKVNLLRPNKPREVGPIRLHGFPWGSELKPLERGHDLLIEVAVIHHYVWSQKYNCYLGARGEDYVGKMRKHLKGYDVCHFGDNHKFLQVQTVFNPGTFIRRKLDERGHTPCVGLLYSDGEVGAVAFDTRTDQFLEPADLPLTSNDIGMEGFIEELLDLADGAVNFAESVKRILNRDKVPDRVKRLILSAMGEDQWRST